MKRPRFGSTKVYNPQRQEKLTYGLFLKQKHGLVPLEGPISIQFTFFMPIPKSYSKKKVAQINDGELYFTKKPDIDNLVALMLNCMTGVVYIDDAQVYEIKAKKQFDNVPRTEIVVCQEMNWTNCAQ